jgi:hypothetical protein
MGTTPAASDSARDSARDSGHAGSGVLTGSSIKRTAGL